MGAMDAKRLELYELLKPKLDEEPARALILALPPDADRIATKDDLRIVKDDLIAMETGLKADLMALEARMDARFARMEATLTRRMVTIMGAWTVLFGSSVGWAAAILR